MSDETVTEIAASVESAVENTNISAADFAVRRLGQMKAAQPTEEVAEVPAEPNVEETAQESTEANESEQPEETEGGQEAGNSEGTEQEETESSSEDVLSQLDLDDMSEEDLRELSEKLGSRAVARFGELTAKRKAAEERIAILESKMRESGETKEPAPKVQNNPFSSLDTIESVQEKYDEVNSVIEWAEETLFNADGYGPEDVVTTVGDKEMTKAEVRKALMNSRKSRDKFLPAQMQVIQDSIKGEQLKDGFQAKAIEELPWLSGEDNDVRHQYNAIMQDKRVESMLKDLPPDVSAQMPYLMAHAANSLYGRKLIKEEKPKASPKLNPPASVKSVAAQSEQPQDPTKKAISKLVEQYRASGDKSDFIKFRTQQLKNQ